MNMLLNDIELSSIIIGNQGYPRLKLLGLTKPDKIGENDFFLLEKFEIDKHDPEVLAALSNALTYQTVCYYMSKRLYISSSLWMSTFDLKIDPEYIDITDKFSLGIQYLIDSEANIDNHLYVYRIFYQNMGISYSSSYVAGVQYVNFQTDTVLPDIFPVKVTNGEGQLYRENSSGKIVVKGLPSIAFDPRFRGPIEYDKKKGRAVAISNSFGYIQNKISEINNMVTELWESFGTMSETSIQNYRRSQ